MDDPRFPRDDSKYPVLVAFEFRLDALTISRNITQQNSHRSLDMIEIHPDPQLYEFSTSDTKTPSGTSGSGEVGSHRNQDGSRVQQYSDFLVVQVRF